MWRYAVRDWNPNSGVPLEEWAKQWADEGWEFWAGTGTAAEVNGARCGA
jgi:hypothetical protein